ncbi:MAG: membrane protein insertase YidC [Vampirovibrionales bacterium]
MLEKSGDFKRVNVFDQALLFVIDGFKTLTGSYALAIIGITILIRVILWPLNNQQTRSMKQMQALQPKLQELKEKYPNDPLKMQQEMMQLYKEFKFNPLGGCLPMLLQLPLLLALYGVLSSPDFTARAGDEQFLFIKHLSHTLQTQGGENADGKFAISDSESFRPGKEVTLTLKEGNKVVVKAVKNPQKPLLQRPNPVLPGDKVTLALRLTDLGLSEDYVDRIKSAKVPVISSRGHELEMLTFTPTVKYAMLQTTAATDAGHNKVNTDVLILIAIYGALTLIYQRQMKSQTPQPSGNDMAAKQAQLMSNLLPLMFLVMMVLIPIPAGVLLYLIVTMVMMSLQTYMLSKEPEPSVPSATSEGASSAKASGKVIDLPSP